MADIDITIFYNQERLDAMRRFLSAQGMELEKAIYDQVDALYESVVPAQERAVLDEKIERENAQRQAEFEAARRFAVVHLHDEQEDYHLISEMHTSFFQSARIFREASRDTRDHSAWLGRMKDGFRYHDAIAPEVFAQYCEDMPNDHRITALIEYDLESGMVSACESSDNHWLTYKLKDVATAAFHAERKLSIPNDVRREIFESRLLGKEIEFEEPDLSEDPPGPTMTM